VGAFLALVGALRSWANNWRRSTWWASRPTYSTWTSTTWWQQPTRVVRQLPGFDQYVLAAGTGAEHVVPPERRAEVSRTAGQISPVVLNRGRSLAIPPSGREAASRPEERAR